MAFFEFMKRMVEGKPVFEDNSTTDKTKDSPFAAPPAQTTEQPPANTAPAAPESSIRKNEDHTFPVCEIRRITTHLDGNNIQVYIHFKNEWDHEIMLDKIRLLNTTRELDTFLRAGEDREFLVYKGPKIMHEYHEAEIDYKTANEGDYFRAVFQVTFTFNADDKSYTINEMHLEHPIRDIYE